MRVVRLFLFLLTTLLILPGAAHSQIIAERITAENFAERQVGGPDADAGVDDWFLSNGTLCAAISDPSHESPLAPQGGLLIDLGHCGAENDQWTVLQPLLNLSQANLVPVREVKAKTSRHRGSIRTRGLFQGVELETTYALDKKRPSVLQIRIEARRVEPGDSVFALGYVMLHPSGQTRPFSLLWQDLAASPGFRYPDASHTSLRSLLGGLLATDLNILVGGDDMAPISYGLQRINATRMEDDGLSSELGAFSVTGGHFTALNILADPLWFGTPNEPPGLLQFAQLPFMDIGNDYPLIIEYELWVGDRADVASITNQLWEFWPLINGRVDEPRARIHLEPRAGGAATEVRPDPDGHFSVRLRPGPYDVRVEAPGGRGRVVPLEVIAASPIQEMTPITLAPAARVAAPAHFIGRLTFIPRDGADPVVFGDDLLGFQLGERPIPSGLVAPFVNCTDEQDDVFIVPVGDYRVLAARGPEYASREVALAALAGETVKLDFPPLERVAPTPGWIAADLHVHTGQSFDSSLPASQQAAAFAASGSEVLVATEHDRIVAPDSAIARAGLESDVVGVTGVEITSSFEGGDSPYATGHLNAFPVTPHPTAYRRGAPDLEGRRLRDALADVLDEYPDVFIQMNHPRPAPKEGQGDAYFSHLGVAGEAFDPTRELSQAPNRVLIEKAERHGVRDLDFHGLELMNSASLIRYRQTRADWFSLLLQGERIVGTANSDSHRLGKIVGLPRTYVRVDGDSISEFDESAFFEALHAGKAYGSTGPLLRVRLDEADLGELHSGSQGTLRVDLDAADWVPVSEWRAYVNGELVHKAPTRAPASLTLPLVFTQDSIVTVEVQGPAEGFYAEALPGFVPFAFTNPIYVDGDGDGRFDAPGLPQPRPRTMRDPDTPD